MVTVKTTNRIEKEMIQLITLIWSKLVDFEICNWESKTLDISVFCFSNRRDQISLLLLRDTDRERRT